MKGIILAGGSATRFYPVSYSINKHLVPIYDKPAIYYPLCTLMLADIKEILLITKSSNINDFKKLFGDGSHLGINISYANQEKPKGIAEAFIIAKDFISNSSVCLILGDNIFYSPDFEKIFLESKINVNDALIFAYRTDKLENYGVIELDLNNKPLYLQEKPKNYTNNAYAVPGLYMYRSCVVKIAESLKPSERGELEITDVNKFYLRENKLSVKILPDKSFWFDIGTCENTYKATKATREIYLNQGHNLSCPEEVAYRKRFVSKQDIEELIKKMPFCSYREYLTRSILDR